MNNSIIYKIEDNEKSLEQFQSDIQSSVSEKEKNIILNYPTVYIHNWSNANDYEVYIGESNSIIQRTKQHYADGKKNKTGEIWQHNIQDKNADLYIIGHEHFNKSLTLDIENKLILYMMSVDQVKRIHNMRGNPQNMYYTDGELETIFNGIWKKLRRYNKYLFPSESTIKDSAVFKASPLHKLTNEQERIKELIVERVFESLANNKEKQVIFVEGEAGTGKTVLNSSTFYDIFLKSEELGNSSIKCCLMVNHDEQITVYEQISRKLGLNDKYGEVVCKPTRFINNTMPSNPVDVVFIDEAHLLLTQGKQSYRGNNQLQDIIDRAKVTVVMFDERQVLTTEQFWEADILSNYRMIAKNQNNYMQLKNQLRIAASEETINWINKFTLNQEILPIPKDSRGYEIRIFDSAEELDKEISERAENKDSALSRLVATYDWEYSSIHPPDERLLKYWEVMVGKWSKPWNYELQKELKQKEKRALKTQSWAEQSHTINEIGSTFTIQGFDLNYVGVILGPSVKFRNGKVEFDPTKSYNLKATRNRTLSDGTKKKFGIELIQNEVRVLMTRGVKGLYIYACDESLREELLKMQREIWTIKVQ